MKAAVQHAYGDSVEVVSLEDVAPPRPGDGDVLVRVVAAGVNWADHSMTIGKPYVMRLGYGFRKPRRGIRGSDFAGVVEKVGDRVTVCKRGDEVFGWGTATFAEYAAVGADQVVSKPAAISFEQAAGIAMAGCVALQALRNIGNVEPGDAVLVNGASGGIGSFAVQIAKAMGAEVTGVASTANLDVVRFLGADHTIDYTKEDFTAGSERYDVILDIADKHTIEQRRRVLHDHGTLIPNSGEGGPWFGSIGRIVKARLLSPFVGHELHPFLSVAKQEDLTTLRDMIEAGTVTPVVGKTYSLADTGAAIVHAGSGHARGKIVVTM